LGAAKLSPEPSIFICGDFNFNVGREECMKFLASKDVQVFPRLSEREAVGGHSHNPVCYILTRGPAMSIASCGEHNILSNDDKVWAVARSPEPLTFDVPIEKLGDKVDQFLEEVTEFKCRPKSVIIDSYCRQSLVKFEVTTVLVEGTPIYYALQTYMNLDEQESKRRESTPLKDIFDHNFIRMHAKLGV
jgi:hypothetical protein